MATNEQQLVIDSMKPFKDENLTTSALRVLAFTAVTEAQNALRRGDYTSAQEAAYCLLHISETLSKRTNNHGG